MKYLIYILMLSILTVLIGIAADIFVAFALFIVAIAYSIKFTNMEEV
ncbi:hypothetical protein K2V52_10790 [Staphylococcus nepalensis]|nr:hypothetical protein [Staphylococcus nepalensis]MCD8892455.1 hypothetical protein [Staphylococcus nepalensis]